IGDLERLLTGVRLGHEQLVGVDTELLRILRIQSVLGIDERGDAAALLGVGHGVQGHGRLTGGFWTADLDYAAARASADAQSDVARAISGRAWRDGFANAVTQTHDRALAVVAIDLPHRGVEGRRLSAAGGDLGVLGCTCHDVSSSLLFL